MRTSDAVLIGDEKPLILHASDVAVDATRTARRLVVTTSVSGDELDAILKIRDAKAPVMVDCGTRALARFRASSVITDISATRMAIAPEFDITLTFTEIVKAAPLRVNAKVELPELALPISYLAVVPPGRSTREDIRQAALLVSGVAEVEVSDAAGAVLVEYTGSANHLTVHSAIAQAMPCGVELTVAHVGREGCDIRDRRATEPGSAIVAQMPTCCDKPMRLSSSMGGFMCNTCERFQHRNGNRTPDAWWKQPAGLCDRGGPFGDVGSVGPNDPRNPACSCCGCVLMFSSRQRGDGMCGPCSRGETTKRDGFGDAHAPWIKWMYPGDLSDRVAALSAAWRGHPPIALDDEIDGVPLRDLLALDERARREEGFVRPCSPAQVAAVSAHWSAQLRAKVQSSTAADKERERTRVVLEQDADDLPWGTW